MAPHEPIRSFGSSVDVVAEENHGVSSVRFVLKLSKEILERREVSVNISDRYCGHRETDAMTRYPHWIACRVPTRQGDADQRSA